ncbi:hypothetical protein BKA81DRAFT_367336 [Phyllosticta paracitricarpa]
MGAAAAERVRGAEIAGVWLVGLARCVEGGLVGLWRVRWRWGGGWSTHQVGSSVFFLRRLSVKEMGRLHLLFTELPAISVRGYSALKMLAYEE